jgi:hypothetical protein
MIETTAYPRAALIGNPSDGYERLEVYTYFSFIGNEHGKSKETRATC